MVTFCYAAKIYLTVFESYREYFPLPVFTALANGMLSYPYYSKAKQFTQPRLAVGKNSHKLEIARMELKMIKYTITLYFLVLLNFFIHISSPTSPTDHFLIRRYLYDDDGVNQGYQIDTLNLTLIQLFLISVIGSGVGAALTTLRCKFTNPFSKLKNLKGNTENYIFLAKI
jgi:hypothetical protein